MGASHIRSGSPQSTEHAEIIMPMSPTTCENLPGFDQAISQFSPGQHGKRSTARTVDTRPSTQKMAGHLMSGRRLRHLRFLRPANRHHMRAPSVKAATGRRM
jgi:hypothetical protein